MRRLSVIVPREIEVVDDGTTYEGDRTLQPGSNIDYEVEIIREGSSLNAANSTLQILNTGGQIGGEHNITRPPNSGAGLMPRNFVKPHTFLYAYGGATNQSPGNTKWIGQSDKGIKDYKQLNVVGQFGASHIDSQDNVRFLSYGGDLFILSEGGLTTGNNTYEQVVNLYKYDESDGAFKIWKQFDGKPIDTVTSGNLQKGSPDWVIYEDELYVFYRTVDRTEGTSWVVGYKASGDLSNWKIVGEWEVPKTHSNIYDNFRMRVAEGTGVFLFALFSIEIESDDSEIKDFRVFNSYDFGASIEYNGEGVVGLVQVGREVNFAIPDGLDGLFIPRFKEDTSFTDFVGFSVNFDMFFDEHIGSFVILKPGDPSPSTPWVNSERGSNYLMGIKTVDGDYSEWELFCQLRLDYKISGLNTSDDDPFSETNAEAAFWGYAATDLAVVPDKGEHTLLMCVTERDDSAANYSTSGVAVSEFKIINNSQVSPGLYDEIIAYGTTNHPDYSFVSSLIPAHQTSLISSGLHNGIPTLTWKEVCACKWRNQIVASASHNNRGVNNPLQFWAVIAPWSNLGEFTDYQHSFCRWLDIEPWNWFWETSVTATGTVTWDSTNYYTVCALAADGDAAYISLDQAPVGAAGLTPVERAGKSNHDLKVKFTVDIDSPPTGTGWLEVLRANVVFPTSQNGETFALRFRGDGSVDVVSGTGDTLEETLILGLDYSKVWEFMVHLGTNVIGNDRLMIWYREYGTFEWSAVGTEQEAITTSVGAAARLSIGAIAYSSYNGSTVKIGDIHVGTSSPLYRPVFDKAKTGLIRREPHTRNMGTTIDDVYTGNPVRLADNSIELYDGSKIKFKGTATRDTGTTFTYARTKTRNSVANVTNGVLSSVFDFTNIYTASGQEIILRNVERLHLDALSLVNIAGITSFSVKIGDYNESTQTWTNDSTASYSVPYITLDVNSVDGNIIILNSEEQFATSELKDYNILFWDDSASEYSDQFVVTDNFDGVIMLDRDLPTVNAGDEIRLMAHSASYLVDTGLGDQTSSHISITLSGPTNVRVRSIGEIVVGNYEPLYRYVDDMSETFDNEFEPITVDTGLSYMSMSVGGAIVERGNISMNLLGRTEDDYWTVLGIFSKLHSIGKPFPVIIADDTNAVQTRYMLVDGGFTSSPTNYGYTIEVPLVRQQFSVTLFNDYQNDPPILTVSADRAEPYPSQSVSFTASATDPEGEAVTYEWDFGDGTATTATQNPSHSYTASGEYTAACTATDASGASTTRKVKVYVRPLSTAYYTFSNSPASPTAPGGTTITVTAKKEDATTNTDDQSSVLIFDASDGLITWDGNEDVTYTTNLEDRTVQLTDGTVDINMYYSGIAGTKTITAVDQFGREFTFDIVYV